MLLFRILSNNKTSLEIVVNYGIQEKDRRHTLDELTSLVDVVEESVNDQKRISIYNEAARIIPIMMQETVGKVQKTGLAAFQEYGNIGGQPELGVIRKSI